MNWDELEGLYDRALRGVLSRKKWLFTSAVLCVCGFLTLGLWALDRASLHWQGGGLLFLPLVLQIAVLFLLGVYLSKLQSQEGEVGYRKLFRKMTPVFMHLGSLLLPLVLAYLGLWTLLGIFYLLGEIPIIGGVLSHLLCVGPFLLLLGSCMLFILSSGGLFLFSPRIAAKDDWDKQVLHKGLQAFLNYPFAYLVLFCLGSLPTLLISLFVGVAAFFTSHVFVGNIWGGSFFLLVPCSVLLAPAVVFFFNFAQEVHLWMTEHHKTLSEKSP